jgi:hypothetical protein
VKFITAIAAAAALAVTAYPSPALAAPKAPKATSYQPPKPLPFELTADTVTMRELVSSPATREILAGIDPMLANAGLAGPFGNYTFPQMRRVLPKVVTLENIVKLNAALAKLPREQWPVK